MYRYFVLFITILTGFIFSQTVINGGNLSTANWTKDGSPYQIYGDLEIPYGEKLTIDPGVQVIFYGHYWINVQGAISAKGQEGEMITFTSCDEVTKWFGIRFIYTPQSSPESMFEFCHLSNAEAIHDYEPEYPDIANYMHGGALYFRQFSKCQVVNCIIENNIAATGGGIGLRESSPMIKDNLIRNNISQGVSSGWGSGISVTLGSNPVIKGNVIEYNTCIGDNNYAGGSGIYVDAGSDAVIQNNIVRYNRIVFSKPDNDKTFDGAAFYIHSSSPMIIGNLVYGNSNNIENGGGFWLYRCDSKFINNTIKSNYAANGGGFFLRESNPEFHNNIIRYNEVTGSGSQFYLNDDGCDPDFYHNNIQGGFESFEGPGSGVNFTGAWVNNIDEDPEYVDNGNGLSFNLASGSPCVDAGSLLYIDELLLDEYDLAGSERIFGESIDIGAIESDFTDIEYELLPSDLVLKQNYPNPFNPETVISFSISKRLCVKLNVYNISGQVIATLVNSEMRPGNYDVTFTAGDITSGIYYYRLEADGISYEKKMLLLR